MITRLLAVLAALVCLSTATAAAPSAGADTDTPCSDQLAQLRADVLAVPITGGKVEKERAGLVKIVDDATALVAEGKPADADTKLTNLQTKVDQLAAAGRISPESAATLTSAISATRECLGVG